MISAKLFDNQGSEAFEDQVTLPLFNKNQEKPPQNI